jgi:hypothetical protein
MFKRKCHNRGEAIKIVNGLVVLCRCITAQEAGALYEYGWIACKKGEETITNVQSR